MAKLNNIEVFSELSKSDIEEILPLFSETAASKKSLIFTEGDQPEWFYAVLKGKVKITKLSHDGKEIILELIQPGDLFGAIAVLKGFPYPANAVAMEDSVILKISRKNLLVILDRFPSLMFKLFESLGDRMRDSHETTKNIALEKVSSRIGALLLKLADQTGTAVDGGVEIGLKLTKQDIAEMVGTTVETAIRTMSSFKKSEYIKEEAGKITVLDPSGLELQ